MAANNHTLNQLIDIFYTISQTNLLIADFGYGPTYNRTTHNQNKYPLLWVEDTYGGGALKSDIGSNQVKVFNYSFNLFVIDRIQKGDANYEEALSDCLEALKDVIVMLDQHPMYRDLNINIQNDIYWEPVFEVDDDNLNGWMANIVLRVPNRLTPCTIPQLPILSWTASFGNDSIQYRLVGAQGPQGYNGVDGTQGPQGFQGTGIQGSQGQDGIGITGSQGSQGVQGNGIQGNQGQIGNQGVQGSQGNQGNQGNNGSTGIQGPQGNQGQSGIQGFQGVQGPQGLIGNTGSNGLQGPQGRQGVQGAQGNQGIMGATGTQGNQGPQGSATVSFYLNAYVLYVDPNGNDLTAAVNRVDLPWQHIAAAIAYCASNSLSGYTIYVAPGYYTETSTWNISSNTNITIQFVGNTVITTNGISGPLILLQVSTLSMIGSGQSVNSIGGVVFQQMDSVIRVVGTSFCNISDCSMITNSTAILIDGQNDKPTIHIKNCNIRSKVYNAEIISPSVLTLTIRNSFLNTSSGATTNPNLKLLQNNINTSNILLQNSKFYMGGNLLGTYNAHIVTASTLTPTFWMTWSDLEFYSGALGAYMWYDTNVSALVSNNLDVISAVVGNQNTIGSAGTIMTTTTGVSTTIVGGIQINDISLYNR